MNRDLLIFFGIALSIFGRVIESWGLIFLIIGIILILTGCYLWTKMKNRHWAFMFWGLLTPIGLLGISLLRDKTRE